jgi:multidrug transporter EmrE-like cation transporter
MIWILISSLIIRICSDLGFKLAVNRFNFDSVSSVIPNFLKMLSSPVIWIAGLLALCNFWLWGMVLSNFDLSFAYPLFSICFVLIMIGGKVFFQEHLDPYKWVGMGLISFGSLILVIGL